MIGVVTDDVKGLHIIFSGAGGFCLAPSWSAALRHAWDLSTRATSFADAPQSIWRSGTDRRWDAHAIVAEWDALGWSRPTQAALAALP